MRSCFFGLLLILQAFSGFQGFADEALHPCGLIYSDPRKNPDMMEVSSSLFRRTEDLPVEVDHSSQMPPVKNQSSQGSCVGWAMGYYHKTHTEWVEHQWDVSLPQNQFSPAFIYNLINGGDDQGSSIDDASKIIVDNGVATVEAMPYSVDDYTSWPSEAVFESALPFRGLVSNWTSTSDDAGLDNIKTQLSKGFTAVLGIYVYSNFDYIRNFNNIYCVADIYGSNRGGHAITLVGYCDTMHTNDGVGAFKFVNSWGTTYGNSGYGWMSYQAVKNSTLSQLYAYWVTDRIGYTPLLIARTQLTHNARTRIGIRFGFGSTDYPRSVKDFFDIRKPTLTNHAFPDSRMVFDLTDNISSLSPDSMVFLRCIDKSSDGITGTINYLSTEIDGSSRVSTDPSVTIPDYNTAAYARIKAQITNGRHLSVNHESVVFAITRIGESSIYQLTLKNFGTDTTTINSISLINHVFSHDETFPLKISPCNSRIITLKFTPLSAGNENDNIVITNNTIDSPSINIPIKGTGVIGPLIAMSPEHLNLSAFTGDSVSAPLRISNSGDDTLLCNIRANDTFSVSPTSIKLAPGAFTDAIVQMNAKNLLDRRYPGQLRIAHNAARTASPVFIPCTLSVDKIKRLAVQASSLDFGSLWIGKDSVKTIQLTNNGSDTTIVTSLTVNNAVFACLESAPIKILPFSSSTLSVAFRPAAVQVESGTLIISSNAADNPSLSVTLQGTGTQGPKITVTPKSIVQSIVTNDSMIVPLSITNTGDDTLRFNAEKQTGISTVSGYRWIDSDDPFGPQYRWVDISTSGLLLTETTGCDDCYQSVDINFAFPFYEYYYFMLFVSSNGYLTLDNGYADHDNDTLPDNSMPPTLIAPFFDDLDLSNGGEIYFKGFPDSAIIQYNNVAPQNGSGTYTFQVVLRKNGDIYFYYKSLSGPLNSATAGIQNSFKDDGLAIVYSDDYLKNNLAIKITNNNPWLSLSPLSGTIPPAGSLDLNVKLSSLDMSQGRYTGNIALTHNDPLTTSPLMVPCTLSVADSTHPMVFFETTNQAVSEDKGTVTVRALLTSSYTSDISVPFTVSGTATGPDDHNLASGTIIIKANEIMDSVQFQIANDLLNENNETIVLTLGTPSDALIGTPCVHTVNISDDDPVPAVRFTSAVQNVPENGGTVTITAQLSAISGLPVIVPFSTAGTATGGGTDYTVTSSPLIIPSGSASGTISVSVVNDALREADETIIVTMGTPSNATKGTAATHNVTILDDDSYGTIRIAGLDPEAQVYLYASSGWQGVKQFSGSGSLTLQPGKYQAAIVQKNKRTETLLLTSRRDMNDTVTMQMHNTVPMVFDTFERVVDANGSDINIGSSGSAVMEDIDHDGNEDLVTLSQSGILSIYTGKNTGFELPHTSNFPLADGEVANCLRIIDNNADNVPDYVAGLNNGKIVRFDGSTLARSTIYTADNGLRSIDLCDFNADNFFDLLLGYEDGTVDYAASNGSESFLTPVPLTSGQTTLSVGEGASVLNMAFDGDSLPDLLTVNKNGEFSWFKGNADGTYLSKKNVNFGGRITSFNGYASIAFGFNGMGQLPKIIATDNNGYIYKCNARLSGDFDGDGTVGFSDYMMLVNAWNTKEGDLQYNHRVNFALSSGNQQFIDFYDYMNFVTLWNFSIINNH